MHIFHRYKIVEKIKYLVKYDFYGQPKGWKYTYRVHCIVCGHETIKCKVLH